MAEQIASVLIRAFGLRNGYLVNLSRIRMLSIFGVRGPVTWTELFGIAKREAISWEQVSDDQHGK